MTKHETIKRIGVTLRRDAGDVTSARLPAQMRDLLARLDEPERQWRLCKPARSSGHC
jgi:hypothetical protein